MTFGAVESESAPVVAKAPEGLPTQAALTSYASLVGHLSDPLCVHLQMQLHMVIHEVLTKEAEELP